jgi:hypothetical protein
MTYEPPSKLQIQPEFGMPLKMNDINVFSIIIFIQMNISCKFKITYANTNHFVIIYATTRHFYQMS